MGHRGVRVAEVDDIDDELAELRQLLGGVDRGRGQDALEELIGVADPLLADRLVAVVGDRQGIVQVDLPVAVRQRRRGEDVGIVENIRVRAQYAEGGALRRGEPGVIGEDAGAVREARSAGVVVGPDEAIALPAIECVQPSSPLAVDRIGETDRRELRQPAGQVDAVHIGLPVEPFQVAGAVGRVEQRIRRVEVHLIGLVDETEPPR